MGLLFGVYVGDWLTKVIFDSVLDNEYGLISFKTWSCLLIHCLILFDGVCSTPPNVLKMFFFQFILFRQKQKHFDLKFQTSSARYGN